MNQNINDYHVEHINGRNFWKFMHTTAAYYPAFPSLQQQEQMTHFVNKSAKYFLINPQWTLYWKDRINAHPPTVSNQKELSLWLCEEHNELNQKLGRDTFSCSADVLKRRWGPFINK